LKPPIAASKRPTTWNIGRWCRSSSCRAASASWSGATLEERERIYGIIANAGRWSFALVVVLGLAGGFFVSRRVLKRIDAMTDTAQTIMAGDLAGRLPIAGTGDELDRLARQPQRYA
jgi:HAMP domain-containing protein